MSNDKIQNIPLNQLTLWKGNVRKTQDKGIVAEIAASIEAHGLINPLKVVKNGKGYEVVAGGQRLAAFHLRAKNGSIKKDHAVPCTVEDDQKKLAEISLAENTTRSNMHPADEFMAFAAAVEKGTPIADIAARFGKTEKYIQQRMRLANLSKKVLKALRDAEITLDQAQAFTVTDDHKAQDALLGELDFDYDDADSIRANLLDEDVSVDDKRVKYVTLKAYEKAGGSVKRDLFSTEDDGAYIADAKLLDKLVAEKLETFAAEVRKQGWKWVDIQPNFNYSNTSKLTQIFRQGKAKWKPEQLSIAGAFVTLSHDGKPEAKEGWVRPGDMPKEPKKAATVKNGGVNDDAELAEAETTELSPALIEQLTAHKSAALSASLLDNHSLGLACIAFALTSHFSTGVTIRASEVSLRSVEGSPAAKKMDEAHGKWQLRLPESTALWAWCLKQDQKVLIEIITYMAASCVDAIERKGDAASGTRVRHCRQLAEALKLDMKAWFTPTAANYFGQIGKVQILEAIREAKGEKAITPALEKLKKGDLAREAEKLIAGTGWLPKPLR